MITKRLIEIGRVETISLQLLLFKDDIWGYFRKPCKLKAYMENKPKHTKNNMENKYQVKTTPRSDEKKMTIITFPRQVMHLNKRWEIFSKYRHENKYFMRYPIHLMIPMTKLKSHNLFLLICIPNTKTQKNETEYRTKYTKLIKNINELNK